MNTSKWVFCYTNQSIVMNNAFFVVLWSRNILSCIDEILNLSMHWLKAWGVTQSVKTVEGVSQDEQKIVIATDYIDWYERV